MRQFIQLIRKNNELRNQVEEKARKSDAVVRYGQVVAS